MWSSAASRPETSADTWAIIFSITAEFFCTAMKWAVAPGVQQVPGRDPDLLAGGGTGDGFGPGVFEGAAQALGVADERAEHGDVVRPEPGLRPLQVDVAGAQVDVGVHPAVLLQDAVAGDVRGQRVRLGGARGGRGVDLPHPVVQRLLDGAEP
ncbi:hypothetical protein GCM10018790_46280 [Kitasatospora xanthocidica]|nr:hypothetical protein GCM10018790_46280 [Kitasatospora xanthocidica]